MQIVRYFGVGAVGAAVDFSIFAVMVTGLGIHYLLSGAVGFIVATAIHYLLTIRFVFVPGQRFGPRAELLAVYAVSIVGLLIHQSMLYAGVELLAQNVYACKVVAVGTVFFWNYLVRKNYVFAAKSRI